MNKSENLFDQFVIENILANNQFEIKKINNLESLKSIFFVKEEYHIIEEMIRRGDIDSIKKFSEKQPNTEEYLEIMRFEDQNHKQYIVTVYDSNQLEQDPQVINIYAF